MRAANKYRLDCHNLETSIAYPFVWKCFEICYSQVGLKHGFQRVVPTQAIQPPPTGIQSVISRKHLAAWQAYRHVNIHTRARC